MGELPDGRIQRGDDNAGQNPLSRIAFDHEPRQGRIDVVGEKPVVGVLHDSCFIDHVGHVGKIAESDVLSLVVAVSRDENLNVLEFD